MNERFGSIRIKPEGSTPPSGEDDPKSPKGKKSEPVLTRRNFLIGGAAAVASYAVRDFLIAKDIERETEAILKTGDVKVLDTPPEVTPAQEAQEKSAFIFSPLEQLRVYGEIRDLKTGLQAVFEDHCAYLTGTEKGIEDMRMAAENMSQYDINKLITPFIERGLPEELAYMIAIQETRGKNKVSSRGARGITGILLGTAKLLGFKLEEVNDPYLATQATATYFANEQEKRFGKNADIDILLHAYNAGGGLYGFTKNTPPEERTSENFYKYMEKYINSRYEKIKKNEYTHVLDDEDKTLTHVSKRFKVPLEKILQANNLKEDAKIHKGDILTIPFENPDAGAKIVFSKPMEALRYAPEVKAKYKALKEIGLLGMFHTDHKKGEGALG
jgi:hypothetical protein